jgi:hypothetical protein
MCLYFLLNIHSGVQSKAVAPRASPQIRLSRLRTLTIDHDVSICILLSTAYDVQ